MAHRQFYLVYPQIRESATPELLSAHRQGPWKVGTLSPQFEPLVPEQLSECAKKVRTVSAQFAISEDNSRTGQLVRELREKYKTTKHPPSPSGYGETNTEGTK